MQHSDTLGRALTLLAMCTLLVFAAPARGAEAQEHAAPSTSPAGTAPTTPSRTSSESREVIRIVGVDGEDVAVMAWGGDDQLAVAPLAHWRRTWLGVGLTPMTPQLRAHFGVDETRGVLVSKVVAKSPAERAGVQVGDILLAVGDEPIRDPGDALHAIVERDAGDEVDLHVSRQGRSLTLHATLEENERARLDLAPLIWEGKLRQLEDVPLPEMPDLPEIPQAEHIIQIQTEAIEEAMRELEEKMEKGELQRQIRSAQRMAERAEAMERRLEQLEREMQELERQLQERNESSD